MQDRRRSFRIHTLLCRDMAILRVGRDDVEVHLQNESSCGFGLLVPPGPKFKVGDALFLKTVAGWFSVKAARVEETLQGTLLGLDRGPEVGNLDRPKHRTPWVGIIAAIGLGVLAVPVASLLIPYARSAKPAAVAQPTQQASPRPAARPHQPAARPKS